MADNPSLRSLPSHILGEHLDKTRAAGLVVVLSVLLYSRFYFMLFVGSFVGGMVICRSMFSPDTLVPNVLRWYRRRKKDSGDTGDGCTDQDDELTLLKRICPVCGKENCSRHRPELNIVALQPWTNLKVPEKIDVALEEFLNIVLKEFVYTWYRELSQDEEFTDELKSALRFIVSVLLRRVQKVDIPALVLEKVLKTAITHLHYYLQVKQKLRKGEDMEEALLKYYGENLHCALRTRQSEIDYLRHATERMFPYVLPVHSLKCSSLCSLLKEIFAGVILLPVMDKLADPDMVNNLLLIYFDNTPPPLCHDPPSDRVALLSNFAQPLGKSNSCLHLELCDILVNPEALFRFMQFMKGEASVNVLQFYLSVEEVNSKILTPELSDDQLYDLHQELCTLYRSYCDPTATDRIQFDSDIVLALKEICEGEPIGVVKLQTTTPLFRAYEHAYDLLEHTFLPLFHRSDDYYKMLCGDRLPTKLTRSLSRSMRRQDPFTLSKIGSRIKGVFKTNTVDGKLPDDIDVGEETEETGLVTEMQPDDFMYDGILMGNGIADNPLRDLSAWRVTVPGVIGQPEYDNPKKLFYSYLIDVRRVDIMEDDYESSNWQVERRYNEFYVLEQKLTEFHGEFEECQLPPKKSFGTKSKDFLEDKRMSFELYVQKLLTIPTLRGSELLYSFLTSECEFTSSFLPDINFGKIVKSSAMKLVKERGQHLEPFLHSLQSSTDTAKPRPSRGDGDSDTVSISSEKGKDARSPSLIPRSLSRNTRSNSLTNPLGHSHQTDAAMEGRSSRSSSVVSSTIMEKSSRSASIVSSTMDKLNDGKPSLVASAMMANVLFENNANLEAPMSPSTPMLLRPGFEYPVQGIFDTLVYLAEHLFRAPQWLMTLFLTARMLLKNSVDSYVDWHLGWKLDQVFQEHRLVSLINLLRDVLFFDNDPPRTDDQKKERRDKTYEELKNYIPKSFADAIGTESFQQGTKDIFEALQYPRLNKQLSYMLLDNLLEDILPELLEPIDDDPLMDIYLRQQPQEQSASSPASPQ